MASPLKRKRGSVEIADALKRSGSVNNDTKSALPLSGSSNGETTGLDTAFNKAPQSSRELAQTNGLMEDDDAQSLDSSAEIDDFMDEDWQGGEEKKKSFEQNQKALRKAIKRRDAQAWKLSEPIGGRMLNMDPIFTVDEKFLILANASTVHVYSTANSLLTRSIKLNLRTEIRSRIITCCLSPTDENLVWVACSDGSIFCVDWTNGVGSDQHWRISSTGCNHMTVASMSSAGRRRDIVFTTESRKDGGWRVTANELAPPDGPIKTEARTIYTSKQRVSYLKAEKEGSVIVAASENKILIGRLRSTDYNTTDRIKYEFRVFDSSDPICSLDLRVVDRPAASDLKKSVRKIPIVDLVVGDVRGSIFVHNDLLAKLVLSQDGSLPGGMSMIPRKMHWHRQAVHTVKWSMDANYIISGGSETVLVIWQLDTGKQQYLPHMSATIQNVVVSPTGSSYAVQLANNSAMILSTAELMPTANIAGVQASVIQPESRPEDRVARLEEEAWGGLVFQRTPCVISPMNPSHLVLSVGQTQEMRAKNPLVVSNPFLQTLDLRSGHDISRQALARTNITNINLAPSAHRILEPRVIHMKISNDGLWLATVDEWEPPTRDVEFLCHQGKDAELERQARREIFLKFWQRSSEDESWELVSRIDKPHALINAPGAAGRVLDLAVDPSSTRFATIGEDHIVRVWSTKTRKRNAVAVRGKDGKALKNWICDHAISLGKWELLDDALELPASGSVAFSEDGSLLAAACGNVDGTLHLLNPENGTTRLSHTGLFENDIIAMDFLGQDLVILSDKLNVYDLVADEIRSSMQLASSVTSLTTAQKQEMLHLAIDRKSQTFAVALPRFHSGDEMQQKNPKDQHLYSHYSHTELAVFHPDRRDIALQERFSNLITALLPAVGSGGYIVLDTAAEIRTVFKKGTQAVTAMAQSTSAQQLDSTAAEESTGDLVRLVEEEQEAIEDHHPQTPETSHAEDDDDDDETPVVTSQQLSRIFDVGPAYALPSMEDMFYQVAELFSSKPLPIRTV